MLTQDQIDLIRNLHNKRYSQAKIAKKVKCSTSSVRNYLGLGKKQYKVALPQDTTQKVLNISQIFVLGKCPECGITYPMPRFMPSWCCPACKKPYSWKKPE